MNRDDILAIIKCHEDDFRNLGVVSLSLFGSSARDEATRRSDVDIAVRLDGIHGGFATFGRLELIKRRLTELLGTEVDVIPEPEGPSRLVANIDKDRHLAF